MTKLTRWLDGYAKHITVSGPHYKTKFVLEEPVRGKPFAEIVRRVGAVKPFPLQWEPLASSSPLAFDFHLNTMFTELPSLSPPGRGLTVSIVKGEDRRRW